MSWNPVADAAHDLEYYGLRGRLFEDNENIAYFARVNAGPYMTRAYYESYRRHLRWLLAIKRNAGAYSKRELEAVCKTLGYCNPSIVAKVYRHALSQAYW